jgi:CelD/BcsL family acetyltransferase involved in cellulose biosynthesis
MVEAQMLVEEAALAPILDEWTELANLSSAATCGPAWTLAWWRHLAPPSAELRVIAVRAKDGLIGVLPFYADPKDRGGRRYRLLAGEVSSSVSPLARPDRVWDVAAAAGNLLHRKGHRPDLIEMSPTPAFSPWNLALRESWPGAMRPVAYRRNLNPAPTVSFDGGSFDDWLRTRSSNFRSNARRKRKQFATADGVYRFATEPTVGADIGALIELHRKRWANIDHPSHWLIHGEKIESFLREVADGLLAAEHFRLLLVEIDDTPIGAELAIAAGADSDSVNLGWDEQFKQYAPATLTLLRLIEDGFERGERRLHLGYGRVEYKMSFANGQDAVATDALAPPGGRLPMTLARVAPDVAARRARETAKRILPADTSDRLREIRRTRRLKG